MNAPNDSFNLWESTLMRRLGFADREDMRSLREELLVEHVDWDKVGQRIMLTEKAAEKLAAHLRLFPVRTAAIRHFCDMTPPNPQGAQEGAVTLTAEAVKTAAKNVAHLVVLPQKVVNPHILICRPLDANPSDRTAWVNVRVKTAANFRPLPAETGEILARHLEGKLWEFAGNPKSPNNEVPRCPRWPGRW